jgi:hypothetical protein
MSYCASTIVFPTTYQRIPGRVLFFLYFMCWHCSVISTVEWRIMDDNANIFSHCDWKSIDIEDVHFG